MGYRKRVVVILDSNTLILMARGLIAPSMISEALEASYVLVSTTAVRGELERIARMHPKPSTRRAARAALEIAERLGVEWVPVEPVADADDSIEALARAIKSEGEIVAVATSDRSLRRRLRRLGVPTLYYRETEGRLEADWSPLC